MSSSDQGSAGTPLLLLMKGHPGTGKSTIARLIAAKLRMTIADKDDPRDCLQVAEEKFGPASAWDLNALSYEIMFSVVSTQLACEQSVVVDCPLSKLDLYQQAEAIAHQHHAAVAVIECQPSQTEIWKQRLEARAQQSSASHKPVDWAALTALRHRYQGRDEWSSNGSTKIELHLILDTSVGTAQDHLAQVLNYLNKQGLSKVSTTQ